MMELENLNSRKIYYSFVHLLNYIYYFDISLQKISEYHILTNNSRTWKTRYSITNLPLRINTILF